jgi:hypothetical protein
MGRLVTPPPPGMGKGDFKLTAPTDLATAQQQAEIEQKRNDSAVAQRNKMLGGAVLKEVPMAVNNSNTTQETKDLMNHIQQASADARVGGKKSKKKRRKRRRKTRRRRKTKKSRRKNKKSKKRRRRKR